ncbi:MAG TPA: helix-turn-helix transcriptional regulator [Lysobacter sp.]|jgi:hypothetical protein|nr:helix-turn-helix transcriptional regulator [Lysobacter sp.]
MGSISGAPKYDAHAVSSTTPRAAHTPGHVAGTALLGLAIMSLAISSRSLSKHPIVRRSWRASASRSCKITELKFKPVSHDHKAFLAQASARKGFAKVYSALELEYQVANQMLKARARAGLTQDAVAQRMGTTKSAISRLVSEVGCELQVKLVQQKAT